MLESQVVLNDCLGCFLYYAYYVALTHYLGMFGTYTR